MNKNIVLSELLYIISNHEKGRINPKRIWTKNYCSSLEESFDIMTLIMTLLESDEDIVAKEMVPIVEYCDCHVREMFPFCVIELHDIHKDPESVFATSSSFSDVQKKIIELMSTIISECTFSMTTKEKGYKTKIDYFLRAFHNLPRAFFVQKQSFFNIGVFPLEEADALQTASFYLNLYQQKH